MVQMGLPLAQDCRLYGALEGKTCMVHVCVCVACVVCVAHVNGLCRMCMWKV